VAINAARYQANWLTTLVRFKPLGNRLLRAILMQSVRQLSARILPEGHMHRRRKQSDLESYVSQVRQRQRNTVWPDLLVNSRSVDKFLWTGSPNPTVVQRIGAWLLGVGIIAPGLVCLILARMDWTWSLGSIAFGLVASLAVAFGVRTFMAGFRRHVPEDEDDQTPRKRRNAR
jgi:hypothetical protein